jgi:hypothetical protein
MGALRDSLVVASALALSACAAGPAPAPNDAAAGELLYVWAGDADTADPDFLAVFDARPASPRYGELLTTVPVAGRGNWPHHTEYELGAGHRLFANAWGTGRTFMFDVESPELPRVAGVFAERGGYAYPHSYARLPNGHVLATFQAKPDAYGPPGGIVELDEAGEVVRAVSGAAPDLPLRDTWPYSLLVLPEIDRVVTTNTRMGLVSEWLDTAHVHADADATSPYVQVWRLSDLQLLHTMRLPPQDGGHDAWPAEPRRLANGEVYVNTFSCGIYRLDGLESDAPAVAPVLHTPFEGSGYCAVPVVLGNFWIQPSATERAIVAYDRGDRAAPREVSRVALPESFPNPHWLALDPGAPRLVATADMDAWVLIVNIDPATGALSIDEKFRDAGSAHPGIRFDRAEWPHGATGKALPHGTVFSAGR